LCFCSETVLFVKKLSLLCETIPIKITLKTKIQMKPYNLKQLEAGLQEIAKDIKGQDIINVAAAERIAPTTVRQYLRGIVATPAIGKAILGRCRALIIEKEAA
jgi:hypothetical protein